MNKIDKFYEIKNLLQCPICGKKIRFHAGGLDLQEGAPL